MVGLFRSELEQPETEQDELYYASLVSVLDRKPPKLVLNCDRVEGRAWQGDFEFRRNFITSKIPAWSSKSGVDPRLWRVWSVRLGITKVGPILRIDPTNTREELENDQEMSQLIWVKGLNNKDPEAAGPIISAQDTLVYSLSEKQFFGLRLYVNLSGLKEGLIEKASQIRDMIQTDVGAYLG